MPELPEIEFYRRLAKSKALGRRIASVSADDEWYLKRDTTREQLQTQLIGTSFVDASRTGKVLLLKTNHGDVVSLRFGMTGVLLVDGEPGVSDMQYSSIRLLPKWNRFSVGFEDEGELQINDPRRLGGVEFEPDVASLGVDALDAVASDFVGLTKSHAPVKSWLMNQSRIAGVGNLIVDEVLWRAGIDPARLANSLSKAQVNAIVSSVPAVVAELIERGGSHRGDLQSERKRDGHCPRDGVALQRRTVNGRTTYSCPKHQK